MRRRQEVRVVERRVILGELTMAAPHQSADRHAVARAVVLSFVVTVRVEVDDVGRLVGRPQHVRRNAIDLGAVDRPLPGQRRSVAETSERDPVTNQCHDVSPLLQPVDRADRAGRERDPQGVCARLLHPTTRAEHGRTMPDRLSLASDG